MVMYIVQYISIVNCAVYFVIIKRRLHTDHNSHSVVDSYSWPRQCKHCWYKILPDTEHNLQLYPYNLKDGKISLNVRTS